MMSVHTNVSDSITRMMVLLVDEMKTNAKKKSVSMGKCVCVCVCVNVSPYINFRLMISTS